MIRKSNILGIVFLIGSFLSGQQSIYWEIADPVVNSEFIESYINRLIEVDKFEQNTIQASHSIIVQMDIEDDKISLEKLKAKNYQMGEYQSFDMEEIEQMDPLQINTLMSREYKWKDVSRRDLSELEAFSTVDNVFQERSFKDARDAFWWSNSQISVSTAQKVFIRQKSNSLAFRIEKGFSDMGLSRELSKNLILGISNDIVSSYLIIPGATNSTAKGVGHPLEGNLGFGFKFDTHTLGGQINYMDPDGQDYDYAKVFSRKHLVVPSSSGLLYWSNTFQINRKIDSKYGNKVKDQKKQKAKAEKAISSSRTWNAESGEFRGLFQELKESNAIFIVDRDEKAHKLAEKGKEWTTKSGSVVKAVLTDRSSKNITLLRSKDNFKIVLKIKDLSDEDKIFIESLKWDGKKTKTLSIDRLSSSDQQIIRAATGTVKARSGKGRELKVSEAYASMRLKAGLSFTQFVHGRVDVNNKVLISDRVSGSESIGFYAKVEGVTDSKNSKAYLQVNVSGSGFKAYSLGLEHNVWRMVNLGLDVTLYPKNSFIEFQNDRNNPDSKWEWYPGSRPDESGKGGGTLFLSPFITVNF